MNEINDPALLCCTLRHVHVFDRPSGRAGEVESPEAIDRETRAPPADLRRESGRLRGDSSGAGFSKKGEPPGADSMGRQLVPLVSSALQSIQGRQGAGQDPLLR